MFELHFICPISNIASILEQGIVSHARASRLTHESLADPNIQARRSIVEVPNGGRLHDYANLYINGRNSMMYAVVLQSRGVAGICVLRVDPNVLDLPGVIIADCNASSRHVRFFDPATGLQEIDHAEVFSDSWNHGDPVEKMRHKSRMNAEVLVPDRVDPALILGAYVESSSAGAELLIHAPSLKCSVKPSMFFR